MKTDAIEAILNGCNCQTYDSYRIARAELTALTDRIAELERVVRELELGLENDGYSWTCPYCPMILTLTGGMGSPVPSHKEAKEHHAKTFPNCPAVRAQAEVPPHGCEFAKREEPK